MQEHKPEPIQEPAASAGSPRRPWLIVLLVLLAVVAVVLFVSIQNRVRTRQSLEAWQELRTELEAKGESLEWKDFIPPEVPDELNLYKAPGMQARFSRQLWKMNQVPMFSPPSLITTPPVTLAQLQAMPETLDDPLTATTSVVSRELLRRSFAEQEDEYQLLVEACARPQVRFDADYTNLPGIWLSEMDIPNFVNLRTAAQALVSHANLNLIEGKPDVAVQDFFMVRRLADLSGSSPVLVGAMIRVAFMGLYADMVRDAIEYGFLTDAHLGSIQKQIQDVNLLEDVTRSWRAERASQVIVMTQNPQEVLKSLQPMLTGPAKPFWQFSIDDWKEWWNMRQLKRDIASPARMAESLSLVCKMTQHSLDQAVPANGRVHAVASSQALSNMLHNLREASDGYRLAAIMLPNYSRVTFTTAQKQTQLNQLYVACALERHRLAHGSYPEKLDTLLPDFLDHISNDLFADQPLQYRLNPDGGYDFWSVGWDEKDDGGQPNLDKDGKPIYDDQRGDWVWSSPKR